MREILFRGKRTDNGEWVEGFFAKSGDKTFIIIDNDIAVGYVTMKEVIPETVGQYTGLTDSNGKKVFEDDILRFTDKFSDYSWIGKIVFGNPHCQYSWGYNIVFVKGAKPNTDILLWFDMEETGAYSEIIGNIHDNPELIKGGENDD